VRHLLLAQLIVKCSMASFTTLVDAATLAAQLDREDLVLFDCRFDLGNTAWGESEYAVAHIPGAQYLHLDRDLSGPVTESSGRHPLPDPHELARRLGSRGVGNHVQIVAYDQGNGAHAARLWWLARWIGLRAVAVLDGGMAAWRAAGLPLESAVRAPRSQELTVSVDANAWVTSEAVDALRLRPGNLLIDARGADRFVGNLGVDGRFLGADELRRRWSIVLGSLPPSAVVAMCGSGVTACHNLLALEHAGLQGARLYAGSWSEWIRDPRRPIATGA
jgi:thiosulfate/3-mercaptopyruvate sulfurtransferase